MRYDEALILARRVAEQITKTYDEVAVVCLGGSLATEGARMDLVSDIDLFAFWTKPLQNLTGFATRWTSPETVVAPVRQRAYFIEHRHRFGDIDVDVKHMTVARVYRFVDQEPNLDELYLEKMHSLHRYQILAEAEGGSFSALLARVRERRDEDLAHLANFALETYGKLTYSVIKQGVLRQETLAAQGCFREAAHTLLQVAYLQEGHYPPPFKWRSSESRLRLLPRSSELEACLSLVMDGSATDIERSLADLLTLERIVAGDYSRAPWAQFRTDRWWWWRGYDPIAAISERTSM